MHSNYTVPIWKNAPFTRLLVPLMGGILLEQSVQLSLAVIISFSVALALIYLLFFLLPLSVRFRLQPMQGAILTVLLVGFGALATWQKDIRNSKEWYGNFYKEGDLLMVKVAEPLTDKARSLKATGSVSAIIRGPLVISCEGPILLYFSKFHGGDTAHPADIPLTYGDQVLISGKLQRIRNSGNPGAFDYERYAAFHQLFHNAFLQQKDWVLLEEKSINRLAAFIFTARDYILHALQQNMGKGSNELGIAQALLIGYTNDLDKDLVQAYSNTGVVHIIAISGMHLALIYLLLVAVFRKIPYLNRSRLLQLVMILGSLWLFSLLTGASASVLRAAVMFSFISIGANLKKKSSIYNSLAASAFVLLCYNPFFLWDVGFQLSYLAVMSILVFQKKVYHCWYIKNKWARKAWELAAVSLAAQLLTFPICIYYFHQFPNFFLLTNMIAVPLSSIILYAEIGLVALYRVTFAGPLLGRTVTWLVWLMNKTVLWVNGLPFAVWEGIPATVLSTCLLYVALLFVAAWLINRKVNWLIAALLSLLALVVDCVSENWQLKNQRKLIVYNIPQHRAIDFAGGGRYTFIGDSALLEGTLQKYNLAPTRMALQLSSNRGGVSNLFQQKPFYQFDRQRILLIDGPLRFALPARKVVLDIIIISKNPSLHMAELASIFDCGLYIFDASNSLWKIDKWQKDCEELHLRSYSVPARGAFILDTE